jgi:tetratricopeptide (TPR) repeat protein
LEPQHLIAKEERSLSGEFRRTREHSIPPRSFPPEQFSGKHHPLERHLADHKNAVRRRKIVGIVVGVILLALSFWAGGQYYASVAQWGNPAAPPPKTPTNQTLFESAQTDLLHNKSKSAYDTLFKLVEREPNQAEYRYWLGRAALTEYRAQEAMVHLEKAIALNPKLLDAYLHLAAARKLAGDVSGAENALKQYTDVYLNQKPTPPAQSR